MLTGDLIRPRLRRQGAALSIDTLDASNPYWLRLAAELIGLFGAQKGQTMDAWWDALEHYQGDSVDYIVIRGLAKVLSDAGTFTPAEAPLLPVELRERLFAHGPVFERPTLFHPLTRADVLREMARQLRTSQRKIDQALFADRPANYLLTDLGAAWTPETLVARYNLELARGVLYWASEMRIEIHDTYKDFWRYLKLFKLMFEAKPIIETIGASPDGYRVRLDGPISPFVASTTRYGRQFAAFLPALFLCERWQMVASVRAPQITPGNEALDYRLDHTSPLRSHFKRSGLFDSALEADFAAEFAEKMGEQRGQWLLTREDELLLLDDTVMIPDFALTHKRDGRRALIEIVGFWHPDYLRRKVAKVREAQRRNLILLVYEGVNLAAEALSDVPGEVLYFKNKPVLKDVMAAVERIAE